MSQITCATCRLGRLPLYVLIALLLVSACRPYSLEQMCATRCMYGRGGNLCNCNAVHFAGKRAGELGDLSAILQDSDADSRADLVDMLRGRSSHDSSASSSSSSRSFADPSSQLSSSSSSSSSSAVDAPRLVLDNSGSGSKASFRSRDDGEDGEMVVEGFFGVEGHQKSAVKRLVNLLKAAVDDRLSDSNGGGSRKWQKSSLPYLADGAVY